MKSVAVLSASLIAYAYALGVEKTPNNVFFKENIIQAQKFPMVLENRADIRFLIDFCEQNLPLSSPLLSSPLLSSLSSPSSKCYKAVRKVFYSTTQKKEKPSEQDLVEALIHDSCSSMEESTVGEERKGEISETVMYGEWKFDYEMLMQIRNSETRYRVCVEDLHEKHQEFAVSYEENTRFYGEDPKWKFLTNFPLGEIFRDGGPLSAEEIKVRFVVLENFFDEEKKVIHPQQILKREGDILANIELGAESSLMEIFIDAISLTHRGGLSEIIDFNVSDMSRLIVNEAQKKQRGRASAGIQFDVVLACIKFYLDAYYTSLLEFRAAIRQKVLESNFDDIFIKISDREQVSESARVDETGESEFVMAYRLAVSQFLIVWQNFGAYCSRCSPLFAVSDGHGLFAEDLLRFPSSFVSVNEKFISENVDAFSPDFSLSYNFSNIVMSRLQQQVVLVQQTFASYFDGFRVKKLFLLKESVLKILSVSLLPVETRIVGMFVDKILTDLEQLVSAAVSSPDLSPTSFVSLSLDSSPTFIQPSPFISSDSFHPLPPLSSVAEQISKIFPELLTRANTRLGHTKKDWENENLRSVALQEFAALVRTYIENQYDSSLVKIFDKWYRPLFEGENMMHFTQIMSRLYFNYHSQSPVQKMDHQKFLYWSSLLSKEELREHSPIIFHKKFERLPQFINKILAQLDLAFLVKLDCSPAQLLFHQILPEDGCWYLNSMMEGYKNLMSLSLPTDRKELMHKFFDVYRTAARFVAKDVLKKTSSDRSRSISEFLLSHAKEGSPTPLSDPLNKLIEDAFVARVLTPGDEWFALDGRTQNFFANRRSSSIPSFVSSLPSFAMSPRGETQKKSILSDSSDSIWSEEETVRLLPSPLSIKIYSKLVSLFNKSLQTLSVSQHPMFALLFAYAFNQDVTFARMFDEFRLYMDLLAAVKSSEILFRNTLDLSPTSPLSGERGILWNQLVSSVQYFDENAALRTRFYQNLMSSSESATQSHFESPSRYVSRLLERDLFSLSSITLLHIYTSKSMDGSVVYRYSPFFTFLMKNILALRTRLHFSLSLPVPFQYQKSLPSLLESSPSASFRSHAVMGQKAFHENLSVAFSKLDSEFYEKFDSADHFFDEFTRNIKSVEFCHFAYNLRLSYLYFHSSSSVSSAKSSTSSHSSLLSSLPQHFAFRQCHSYSFLSFSLLPYHIRQASRLAFGSSTPY